MAQRRPDSASSAHSAPPAGPGALPRVVDPCASPLEVFARPPCRASTSARFRPQSTDASAPVEGLVVRDHCGRVSDRIYPRSPPRDREFDASEAWIADLVTAALSVMRAVAAESESVAVALAALERRVSWEGPAAREFRRRTEAVWAGGSASAAAMDALVDDVCALRARVWVLTQDAALGG